MKISQLTLDTGNANRGTDRGRKALAESLKTYGAGRSILVDKKGRVIAGNKTLEQAIAQGHKDILVVKTDGSKLVAVQRMDLSLSDKRAKALAIADNRVGELDLEWDAAVLAELGKDIDLSHFWDAAELEALLGTPSSGDAPEAQLDKASSLQKKWNTQFGQLWIIGNHRIICADNSDAKAIKRLMRDASANLAFTSPPYAQQREYTKEVTDWDSLMQGAFSGIPVKPDAQLLVNLGLVHEDGEWQPYWSQWIEWMKEQGWRRFGWYVWDQGPGMPGEMRGRLGSAHEFIFHFNRSPRIRKSVKNKCAGQIRSGGGQRAANGVVKEYTANGSEIEAAKIHDSVFRVNRAHPGSKVEAAHPAIFPVDLCSEVILAFTEPGDIVYEPFCGAGTQIVSADLNGRACYALEIEPKYVAVSLERLSDMGLKPKLSSK